MVSQNVGNPAARGTVITLFGAVHCTGKTTIAVNLAAALAQGTGQRVALIDLDTFAGDVAIMMDIPQERSVADLATQDGDLTIELLQDCLYTHKSGVIVLPAPLGLNWWRRVRADDIGRVVTLLALMCDYVILDTSAFFTGITTTALELASNVLLAARSHPASLNLTRLALDLPFFRFLLGDKAHLDKTKLIVSSLDGAASVQPEEVRRILGPAVFSFIPYDRNISVGTQLGVPLVVSHPHSQAAQAVVELAARLMAEAHDDTMSHGGEP